LHGYDIHQATHPADRKRGGSGILIKSCVMGLVFIETIAVIGKRR